MRLLVLESSVPKEKAKTSLEQVKEALEKAIKVLEKKELRCEADINEELKRFRHEKGLRLYECSYETEKKIIEKWPKGRRGKNTEPMKEESWHIHVSRIEKEETNVRNIYKKSPASF